MAPSRHFRSPTQYLSRRFYNAFAYFRTRWQRTLRIGLTAVVLLFAAALGLLAGSMDPAFALVAALLPFIPLGIEFVLGNEENMPVMVLLVAAFIPISLSTGTSSRLVLSLIVTVAFTGLWLLRMLVIEKRFSIYETPINLPLFGFIITTAVSLIWSNLFRDLMVSIWDSFPFVQIAATMVMIMLPVAFILTINLVRSEKTLKLMIGIMLVAGVIGLIRNYLGLRFLQVNLNGLFAMWVISISLGMAFFNRKLGRLEQWFMYGLAALWIYWGAILHISWLAGWLPGLLSVVVLTFLRSKKLTAVLLVALLVFVLANESYFTNVIAAEQLESGSTRLQAWETNWRITKDHMLFGTGPAGYAAYYMSYFPLEGTATHNNFIDVVAQTGLVGLTFCLWFFIRLLWMGYQLTQRLKGRGDFLEGLANAAFAGTVGCVIMMGFGDWIFPFAYTQTIAGYNYIVYNWIFMGMIVVVDRITKAAPNA